MEPQYKSYTAAELLDALNKICTEVWKITSGWEDISKWEETSKWEGTSNWEYTSKWKDSTSQNLLNSLVLCTAIIFIYTVIKMWTEYDHYPLRKEPSPIKKELRNQATLLPGYEWATYITPEALKPFHRSLFDPLGDPHTVLVNTPHPGGKCLRLMLHDPNDPNGHGSVILSSSPALITDKGYRFAE